jgi:hypothetical protein
MIKMQCPFFINPNAYQRTVPYDIEQWYPLRYPGIKEDMYLISTYGRVYSKHSNKFLTPFNINSGYQSVHLADDNGNTKNVTVHRLMAYTFGNPPINFEDLDVNHIDGDKTHNTYTNVEWVTKSENMRHAVDNNLAKSGEDYYSALITNEQAIQIAELMQEGVRCSDILKQIGLPVTDQYKTMVENIRLRKSYRNICKDYDFSNYTGKTYSNDEIHVICRMIADDVPIADICEAIEGRKYMGSKKDKKFYEYIRLLKNKKTFREISDQYF